MLQWLSLGFSLLAVVISLRSLKLTHKALRRRNRRGSQLVSGIALPRAKQAAGGTGGHVTVLPKEARTREVSVSSTAPGLVGREPSES